MNLQLLAEKAYVRNCPGLLLGSATWTGDLLDVNYSTQQRSLPNMVKERLKWFCSEESLLCIEFSLNETQTRKIQDFFIPYEDDSEEFRIVHDDEFLDITLYVLKKDDQVKVRVDKELNAINLSFPYRLLGSDILRFCTFVTFLTELDPIFLSNSSYMIVDLCPPECWKQILPSFDRVRPAACRVKFCARSLVNVTMRTYKLEYTVYGSFNECSWRFLFQPISNYNKAYTIADRILTSKVQLTLYALLCTSESNCKSIGSMRQLRISQFIPSLSGFRLMSKIFSTSIECACDNPRICNECVMENSGVVVEFEELDDEELFDNRLEEFDDEELSDREFDELSADEGCVWGYVGLDYY
jgi:hypothetical protein